MHSIWLSVIVPSLLLVVWGFPSTRVMRIWLIGIVISVVGLALVVGMDVNQFIVDGGTASHWWRRAILTTMSAIDIPVIAALIGCSINFVFSWRTALAGEPAAQNDSEDQPELQAV